MDSNLQEEYIFKMTFAYVYPHYLTKVEKKGKSDVAQLNRLIEKKVNFSTSAIRHQP
jgi:hypothetical protein